MKWVVPDKAPREFFDSHPNIHPTLLQYFWNKGVTSQDYIDAFLNYRVLHDTNPFIMKDMRKAAERVWHEIHAKRPVVIYGDYDADGVTATSYLTMLIESLGGVVHWYVPHRDVGYGMRAGPVEQLVSYLGDSVSLIVTVDNGIKATNAVTRAVELGLDVIVTDHHSVDYSDFPHNAYAVVNPQQDECKYPETMLSGSGVAYKLGHALAIIAEQEKYASINGTPEEHADQWLDCPALGTIGDMMPLMSLENRRLVKRGMDKMASNPLPGVYRLAQASTRRYKFDLESSGAVDYAFGMVPLLNAASRVDDPKWAVELLTSANAVDASPYANKLVQLNEIRKEQQNDYMDEVVASMEATDTSFSAMPIIIQKLDNCPHGLIGLVAGSLNHTYGRPTAVLSRSKNPGIWKASARSIDGMNIAQALRECDDLLISHGGHSMAAGFGINESDIPEFIERITAIAHRELSGLYADPVMRADIEIPLGNIDWNLFAVLQAIEPYSSVDWTPVRFLTRGVKAADYKRWSVSKRHLQMTVFDNKGNSAPANGWHFGEWADKGNMPDTIDIIYTLESVEWGSQNGRPYLRIAIEAIRESTTS